MSRKTRPDSADAIVRRRMAALFEQALLTLKSDEQMAIHYIKLARKLSARHRIALGRAYKKKFCSFCSRPWLIGYNVKVRLRSKTKRAEYECACGKKRYFVYCRR